MPTPSLINWLVLIVAGAMALAGLVVARRALFHDRSRGRRRCPRCWYDMTGVAGLTCPECGRDAINEHRLLRTRRRYPHAFVGLMLILLAGSLVVGQEVRKKGWLKAAPNVAYIAAFPWIEPKGSGMKELGIRLEGGTIRAWELRWLISRCIGVIGRGASEDPVLLCMACRVLCVIEEHGKTRPFTEPLVPSIRVSDVDREGALRALTILLDHQDPEVCREAAHTIGEFEEFAAGQLLVLLAHLDSPHADVVGEIESTLLKLEPGPALEWTRGDLKMSTCCLFSLDSKEVVLPTGSFRECLREPARAREILLGLLEHKDAPARASGIWGLQTFHREDAEVERRVFALADDPDWNVRRAVVHFAAVPSLNEQKAKIILAAISDNEMAETGLTAAARFSASIDTFGPAIRVHLEGEDPAKGLQAIAAWVETGGDRRVASAATMRMIERWRSLGVARGISEPFDALAWIDDRSPELMQQLAALMKDSKTGVRAGAAFATARLGGDREQATKVLCSLFDPSVDRGTGAVVARPAMILLAQGGELHLPTLQQWLEGAAWSRELAIDMLYWYGPAAAPALPKLRELLEDPDPSIAFGAKRAVKRLEWEMANPEEAARRRAEYLKRLR